MRKENPEIVEQLELEGFFEPELPNFANERLNFMAALRLMWENFRHPKTPYQMTIDSITNQVRFIHTDNPEEVIKDMTRIYKPI